MNFWRKLAVFTMTGVVLHAGYAAPPTPPPVFPPAPPGWTLDPRIESYDEETLYDRINGAAEFFFSYNFVRLDAATYRQGDRGFSIEIFRHADPIHAFGAYAGERDAKATFLELGAQGYTLGPYVYFVTGPYYVRIQSPDMPPSETSVLIDMAKAMEQSLGTGREPPAMIRMFPLDDRVPHSEEFFAADFLSMGYMRDTWRMGYQVQGHGWRTFITPFADEDAARAALTKYRSFAKLAPEDSDRLDAPARGVTMIRKGRWIIGFQDGPPESKLAAHVTDIEQALATPPASPRVFKKSVSPTRR
jgi:hypothetical protein